MLKRHGLLGLAVFLAVFAIGVGMSTLQVKAQTAENCTNGEDDDKDGFPDCTDSDCADDPGCKEPPAEGCISIELPEPGNSNKVTLCHFTGSSSNPFVVNEVSKSAASQHFGHHGDCVNPPGPDNTACF
jgi:hypothetical protein